jgi:hypothetical protein
VRSRAHTALILDGWQQSEAQDKDGARAAQESTVPPVSEFGPSWAGALASGDNDMPGGHGGTAEFDELGNAIRLASSADTPTKMPIRVYALTPMPQIDRLVTTSALMMETIAPMWCKSGGFPTSSCSTLCRFQQYC